MQNISLYAASPVLWTLSWLNLVGRTAVSVDRQMHLEDTLLSFFGRVPRSQCVDDVAAALLFSFAGVMFSLLALFGIPTSCAVVPLALFLLKAVSFFCFVLLTDIIKGYGSSFYLFACLLF